jgi:transposase
MEQSPADFRDRLLRASDAGLARAEAARACGVAVRAVQRWQRRRRATGGVAPAPRPGRPPRLGAADLPALEAQPRARPDATLAEHRDAWGRARGGRLSVATMSRAVRRAGWAVKSWTVKQRS